MSVTLSGAYSIDGIDLYDNFGITLSKGSLDDFLKLPTRKQSIEHSWKDEDGLDVDLSRNFYESREINIKCYIFADSETEYWTKYDSFLTVLRKPGTRRFSVNAFSRDYYVFYKECTIYDKLTKFQNSNKLFCSFNLKLIEQTPKFNNSPTYIIDEAGRFLIT